MPFHPPNSWAAFYYDGRTADREPVRVTFSTGSLAMQRADGSIAHWPYPELRRGAGAVEGGPFRLERGSPAREVLMFSDPGAAAALRAVNPYGGLAKPTQRGSPLGKMLLALLLATIAAGFALYKWVLPATGEFLAARVPPSWEAALGATVIRQITMMSKVCDSPESRAPVERILSKITAQYPDNPYTFKVYVVDSDLVNALAAPGGHVVVYRGLLDKTRSPEELAAVLAHEVAHVVDRHSTKAMMRSLTFWTLVSFLAGDTSGAILSIAGTLEELRFSRTQEERADAKARRVFEETRMNPAAMLRVFQMLEDLSADVPGERYLSTHPRMKDRVETIAQWQENQRYTPRPVLPGSAWPPSVAGCAAR